MMFVAGDVSVWRAGVEYLATSITKNSAQLTELVTAMFVLLPHSQLRTWWTDSQGMDNPSKTAS